MLQSLVKEMKLRKGELKELVETIYFGGGTPSLLEIDDLQLLTSAVYQNYEVIDKPEITLEANPDDLSALQIKDLAKTQINRLSIGIQSFFDEDLRLMNRAHTSEEAKKSLSIAINHFDNITIDLIYGIPNMSKERWKQNLEMAFDFRVNHISSYALTVEPKTALAKFIREGKYPNVSEELALEHYTWLVKETEEKGFVQYEISNFGKPDFFSKHNISYWQGKPYLGLGPSSHSFDGKRRSWNVSNNSKYIKAIQQDELPHAMEDLSVTDRFNETIMIGLRTHWGVSINQIEGDFGEAYKDHLLTLAKRFVNQDLLEIVTLSKKGGVSLKKLKATKKGSFLIDGIASELFMI